MEKRQESGTILPSETSLAYTQHPHHAPYFKIGRLQLVPPPIACQVVVGTCQGFQVLEEKMPDNTVEKTKGKVERCSRAAVPEGGLPFAQEVRQLYRRMGTAEEV